MDTAFTIVFALVILYELLALAIDERGDTISERNVALRHWRMPWGRVLFDVFVVWYLFHIYIDAGFSSSPSAGWVDVLLAAAVAALSWALGPKEPVVILDASAPVIRNVSFVAVAEQLEDLPASENVAVVGYAVARDAKEPDPD